MIILKILIYFYYSHNISKKSCVQTSQQQNTSIINESNEEKEEKLKHEVENPSNESINQIDSSPLSNSQMKQSYSIICKNSQILITTILNFLRFYLSEYIEFQQFTPKTNTLIEIVISSLLELLGDLCWISPNIVKNELMEVSYNLYIDIFYFS